MPYHAREGQTSYIFSLHSLPSSLQGSNLCPRVCCSFLCNIDQSHLLHVLEDSCHHLLCWGSCLELVWQIHDSTPWIAVLFLAESDESIHPQSTFRKAIPISVASNSASVCFFLCSGLSCCGTNHEDFWISQALKYHVHTLSLIQSCNLDSLQVTHPYELFYQAVKAELVYSLYGSLSRLAFHLSDDLTWLAQYPAVFQLIMQPL